MGAPLLRQPHSLRRLLQDPWYLSFPIYACIWPDIVSGVSTSMRELVEAIPAQDRAECPIDIEGLREQERMRLTQGVDGGG